MMERVLRGIAGVVVLGSLALAWSTGQVDLQQMTWLWLTAFVGLNLLQSAFTDWCPMIWILERFGLRRGGALA